MKRLFVLFALALSVSLGCIGPSHKLGAVVTHDPSSLLGVTLYRPIGGGADDGPSLRAALARGPVILVNRATYTILTTGQWVDWSTLYGNGAIWNVNIPQSGDGYSGAPVYTYGTGGTPLALAADTVAGSRTIQTTSNTGLVVGDKLQISAGLENVGSVYTIKAIAGSGNPYTITLDRAVLWVFKASGGHAAGVVPAYHPSRGVTIHGGGMQIIGTGDRVMELGAAEGALIEDIDVFSTGTGFLHGIALDIGSYRSTIRRVRIDGGRAIAVGFPLESTDSCSIQDSGMVNGSTVSGGAGWGAYNTRNTEVRGFQSSNNAVGAAVEWTSPHSFYSSDGLKIIGGEYSGNIGDGIVIADGSNRVQIVGVTANYNGGNGLLQSTEVSGVPTNTLISDSKFSGNTGAGVYVTNGTQFQMNGSETNNNGSVGIAIKVGVKGTRLSGGVSSNNGQHGIYLEDEAALDGYDVFDNATLSGQGGCVHAYTGSGPKITINACRLGFTTKNGQYDGIYDQSNGYVRVTNTIIELGSGTGIKTGIRKESGTGELMVSNTKISSTTSGNYGIFVNGATGSVRLGENVDVSAVTNQYTLGTQPNNGTINATTTVSRLSIHAGDICVLMRKVDSGTLTTTPKVVVTEGQAVFTLGAGDASTYDWKCMSP